MSAAKCTIRMRSQEKDRVSALILLRKDLVNGPCHCFSIHTHYSSDFCTIAKDQQHPTSSSHNDSTEDSTTLIMLHFLIDGQGGGGAS